MACGQEESLLHCVETGAEQETPPCVSAPLSFAQQRLWFLDQLEPGSAYYNIPVRVRLRGPLRVEALERSFDQIVARHETLRTRFVQLDDQPLQFVDPPLPVPIPLTDLSHIVSAEQRAHVLRIATAEAELSFDLAQGNLMRVRLLKLDEEDHVLLMTLHHIISDWWSMGVLSQELSEFYSACCDGRSPRMPKLSWQYRDFAEWQRQWLQGEVLESELNTWRKQLAGAPVLQLPTDKPRPALQSYRGDVYRFVVDKPTTDAVKALSWREGATPFMTLLAAFQTLLYRHSAQQDISVGTVIAGRTRAEVENLIGFFVNTLVLRTDLSGNPAFRDLLMRVREVTLNAYEHQEIPFERLVNALDPVRDLGRAPYIQSMFILQTAPLPPLEMSGLTMEAERSDTGAADFDLILEVVEAAGVWHGSLEYNTDIFEEQTIRTFAERFNRLLRAVVADPGTRIDQLPLLSSQERRRLLLEWNDTEAEFPGGRCLHELFEEQASRTPDAIAVSFESGALSYSELNRRANQLAHHLRALGVKPEMRVAICADRGLEMLVALLAVFKAGGAYVPLDPQYPAERLAFVLEDAAPVVLLTQGHLAKLFAGDGPRTILDLTAATEWQDAPETNLASEGFSPSQLAYVIYTSGSTGQPKGVMVIQRGMINHLYAKIRDLHLAPADTVAQTASLCFDISVWQFFAALLTGGRVLIVGEEEAHDPALLVDLAERLEITVLETVPSLLRAIIEKMEITGQHLPCLRWLLVTGEAFPVDLARRWEAMQATALLMNAYGPTECSDDVTHFVVRKGLHAEINPVPIGRPIANTQVYILDAHAQPVPVGVTGELCIGGAGVARGYLNRPELTAERFVADPFASDQGARMYRTGDLGRWLADGNIEFLGRNDFQVKIRGFRIELGEIEARLMEDPAVRAAAVIAREDTPGDKRLVAYYTGSGDEDGQDADRMRSRLSACLPEYMVPTTYMRLPALPLTPNGKLDRKALPAPDADAYSTRSYEAPQGQLETKLAQIWAEVLKLERVGRHDDFFELGGHSLLAVTMTERMRRSGFEVGVRSIFTAPTVASLAAAMHSGSPAIEIPPNRIPAGCKSILPEMLPLVELTEEEIGRIIASVPGGAPNIQDIYPLTPAQEGILFHHLMGGVGDPYILASQFSFDTRLRLDEYLQALQAVVNRHDILRTSVMWEGLREPVQVVWRNAQLPVDEAVLDPEAGDASGQLYARFDPRSFRIDVRKAPLLRIFVAYDQEMDRWLMQMLLQHLVSDNSILAVMHEEVQAHLRGQQNLLPTPLPYRNLVAQTRFGVSQQEHEEFFRKMLGDVDEPTAPFGLLDVQGNGSGIEEAVLVLDAELARRLRANARKLGVSAASLFHLAWAQVLARVSSREDVVFGTVLFGRMSGGADVDRMMGLFINTLPIRIPVAGEGVEASVRRTHSLLADLMRHEHASLALAQRCSAVAAPTPLFSALLDYRHSPGPVKVSSADPMQPWKGIQILRGEERTNYPLTLSVDDLGEGFALATQTPNTIGAHRTCEFMRTALGSLANALEISAGRPVRTLDVLPSTERRRLLLEWNDTEAEFPGGRCLHELFEEQASRTPDAIAVSFESGALSYSELNRRANQLAHHLRALGVKPEMRVAICADRGLEMLVALLAVFKAGGAYVPLDPQYPAERLAFVLEDAAPVVLLTQGHLAKLFAGDGPRTILDLTAATEWQDAPETNLASEGFSPSQLAYVIYTSGSTGQPKGVMVIQRGMINHLYAKIRDLHLAPADTVAQTASLCFDISVWQFFAALLTGGRVLIVGEEEAHDPALLVDLAERLEITVLETVPSLLRAIIEKMEITGQHLPCLRWLLVTGEAFPVDLARRWEAMQATALLMNAYGPTECSDDVTHFVVRKGLHAEINPVPIGRPIANTQVYILDAHAQPVPVGVTGELCIGGAGVARGYLNRPELTAERFVADPFASDQGARMYRTGDLGRWLADGNIEFLGRNDFQVKIRGFRIELGEIEARLMEDPAVRAAAVIAREDTPGDKRLVAYYTGSGDEDGQDADRMRSRLSACLPEYMVPTTYMRLPALPLTPNGKLDRKALPAPDADAYSTRSYEAPQGQLETKLAQIWAEVLKLERVGRHDDFFELGGHSLLMMRVVAVLEQHGIKITITDLFANRSVAALSELLDVRGQLPGETAKGDKSILVRKGGAERPLFLTHCALGELLYLLALAPAIDAEIPIYGLPARSVEQAPLNTVEAMASRMVHMIRAVQPAGPYRIAGWSFGGILAYEIAAQLIAADQEVEFLGMMDTYYSAGINKLESEPVLDFDEKQELLIYIQDQMDAGDERRATIEKMREDSATMDFLLLARKVQEDSLVPPWMDGLTAAQAERWRIRSHAIGLANRNYAAVQIPSSVHLFTAQESHSPDTSLGWNTLFPEDLLHILPVPGTHYSMIRSPQVEILGRSLSDAIRNVDQSPIGHARKHSASLFTSQEERHNEPVDSIVLSAKANG